MLSDLGRGKGRDGCLYPWNLTVSKEKEEEEETKRSMIKRKEEAVV